MNLKDHHICVDGVNIQDRMGTGIKTYALTLLKTLNTLGAKTSVLLSNRLNGKHVDLYNPAKKSSKDYYCSFLNFILGLPLTTKKLERHTIEDHLMLPKGVDFYNFQRIYDLSNTYFNDFRKPTKLKFNKGIDVFHMTTPFALDVLKAKKVTTIHDLIPFILPETCIIKKPRQLFQRFEYAAKSSDLVITVSEHAKSDIVEHFKIDPERVRVTYQTSPFEGIEIPENCPNYHNTLKKHNLKEQSYFLFVGGIEPKKNLTRLIEAYSRLSCGLEIPLVVIGKKAWLYDDVFETASRIPGGEYVQFLDYIPFSELPYFFKGACAFVFPSIYEGFGLPVLEALNFNCPVITSNVSSLPEVCGKAGLLINPYNIDELTQAMKAMIDGSNTRVQLTQHAKSQSIYFSEEAYAKRLQNAYDQL